MSSITTTAAGTAQPLTMSSLEIAELTEKEHRHVLADIRKMLNDLGLDCAEFSAQYRDSTGRTLPMFNLPKDLTLTLVSGYSIPLRHRIVTRLQALQRMGRRLCSPVARSLPSQARDVATSSGKRAGGPAGQPQGHRLRAGRSTPPGSAEGHRQGADDDDDDASSPPLRGPSCPTCRPSRSPPA